MDHKKQFEREAMDKLERDYGPRHTPGWIIPAYVIGGILLAILGDLMINHWR